MTEISRHQVRTPGGTTRAPTSDALASERECRERREAAMAWVRKEAPWLPGGWVGVYAGYAMSLKHRLKRAPTIDQITAHLRGLDLYSKAVDDPELGIKPTKEETA